MKIKILLILVVFGIANAKAQTNINDYKYVTVPYFFEFVKGKNAHRLNTTTRFLLKKNGLNAFMDDELSAADFKNNNCLALKTDVVKVTAILKTKLKIVLKNCNDEVIYESKVGESKAKSYDEAYTEALIDAFESFASLNYQYSPSNRQITEEEQQEKVDEAKEIETIEENKQSEKVEEEVSLKKVETAVEKEEVIEESIKEGQEEIQEAKELEEEVSYRKPEPKNAFYAQAINDGYQIVDKNSKVVMTLLKTSVPNVFVVKDKNAIAFEENGMWFISKNVDGQILKEPIVLKF